MMDDDRFTSVTEEYECDVCGASFIAPLQLQRHIRRDHPDDQADGAYRCTVCGDAFNTPRQLRRHIHNRHGAMSDIR